MEKPIKVEIVTTTQNVTAADLGFEYQYGFLVGAGSTVHCLPHVAEKLIRAGKAVAGVGGAELKAGAGGGANKMSRGGRENK